DSLSFDGLRGSFPGGGLPLAGAVTGPVRLDGTLAALATHADLQSSQDGGGVQVDGVLTLLASRLGARDATVRTRELDLSRWLAAPAAPSSRLSGTLAGTVGADSGAAPAGAVTAALGPSLFAGAGLDSGVARLRFADRRVYVDSLRLSQPGLITTGSGVLGWARPARGTLSLDLDADSLNSVDSLIAWVAGRALGREGGGGGRSLAGAARVAVTLEGALDSLAVEARASLERLRWREWEVPAGRARVTYRPGPVPAIAGEVTRESRALGGGGSCARGTCRPGAGPTRTCRSRASRSRACMRCCRRTPRAWAGRSAPPPRSRARGRSPCTRGRSRSRTARSANSTLPMWTAASSIATAGSSPPCTCGARASRSSPSRPISRSISRSRRWSGA